MQRRQASRRREKKRREREDMGREYPDYRNTIEQLNRLYPERELLTMEEVMKITGYKTKDSVRKHYPFVNRRINKATLARCLCAPQK